jgi:hypothetical protein
MCQYSGINDPQHYTKEELALEEVEHQIRDITKVGRDVELKLGMPMYENNSFPDVSVLQLPPCICFLQTCTHSFYLADFHSSPHGFKPHCPLPLTKRTYRQ